MSRLIKRMALVLAVAALPAIAACSSLVEPEPALGVPIEEWRPGEDAEPGSRCMPTETENGCYQL